MSPFECPKRIFVSTRPQDMRAGIDSLAYRVEADFGRSPEGGELYVFVSRDATKAKMVACEGGDWVLWYVRLGGRVCRWTFSPLGEPFLSVDEKGLLQVLAGGVEAVRKRRQAGAKTTRPLAATLMENTHKLVI